MPSYQCDISHYKIRRFHYGLIIMMENSFTWKDVLILIKYPGGFSLQAIKNADIWFFFSQNQTWNKQAERDFTSSSTTTSTASLSIFHHSPIWIKTGPWFNIKMSSYQYRKSHCGDKTVVRSSYLHNGISYTGKMTSLYWIRVLEAS